MIKEDILNFDRLRNTDLMCEFVVAHKGVWNHEEWLGFCAALKEKGFTPIDYNKVGAYLEKLKEEIVEKCLDKVVSAKCKNCGFEVLKPKCYFVYNEVECPKCGVIIKVE